MKRVLLLSHTPAGQANTVLDHAASLLDRSDLDVIDYCPVGLAALDLDLSEFDTVIIHYSLICFSKNYIGDKLRAAIARFTGLKCIFIQDEYRFVNSAVEAMIELGVDVLFTCVPENVVQQVYGRLLRRGVRIVPTLTGYVPDSLRRDTAPPLRSRPLDVVYRSRQLPFILGNLGQEKTDISNLMKKYGPRYGLRIDVEADEEKRLYGEAWTRFLASGRAALGTESGASICDFTGELDSTLKAFLREFPNASYRDAFDAFLWRYEGNAIINAISPRVFESISLGTALVQYPGEYSGILQEGVHFIRLEKDFSNIEEVTEKIKDDSYLEALCERAYEDIIRSEKYSYRVFADQVYELLLAEWQQRVEKPAVFVANDILQRPSLVEIAPIRETLTNWKKRMLREQKRIDLASANEGATISSNVAFFPRPYDLEYLLRESRFDLYAAALPDQQLPQVLTVVLKEKSPVAEILVEWFDIENYASEATLEISPNDEGKFEQISALKMQKDRLVAQLNGRLVKQVRLTLSRIEGQQRMLVRSFHVILHHE